TPSYTKSVSWQHHPTSDSWTSFFRFNTAWGWGEREEQGVKRLGELIREQLA
uniref:hypothetical protein n=1 Tax=Klebsiella pneumoniae TaxID=573 RepID=UPI001D0E0924